MDFSKIKINKDLPIGSYEEEIIEKFQKSSNMIIIGETGSGKTTQIPLILLKTLSKVQDLTKGKIAVTQPRRLAATSVAKYESELLGEELGKSVGYKIRFNEITSQESKLIFMTDGIMLREAQIDPLLQEYSVVMVDEAHERNINSDFLIGLLVDIQKKRKEQGLIPLKILITSATLEKEKFENFFTRIEGEPLGVVEVPGRLFPITSSFESREVFNYEIRASEKVMEICQSGRRGDILIFMPGKREIEKTKEAIEALPEFESLNLEIITVHANLPIEEQNKIFKETDKRKVVIATNIAETSLTVPGVVHVIDSGLIKQMEFNPHTGLNSLVTNLHAKKGLEQRKGRAGRIEPGFYYALFTEQSFYQRPEFQIPEILRTSLSQVILIMKRIGIQEIEEFKFVDQPDFHLIRNAIQELKQLGALDKDENITEKGITMASLPLEPRLANLIIEAQKNKCVEAICTICSFLELKPVILRLTIDDIYKELKEQNTNSKSQIPNNKIAVQETPPLKGERGDVSKLADNSYQLPIGREQGVEENLYDKAEELFYDYLRKTRAFEYRGSDFFTILKIWNQWIKNEMQPEWAEHNYLDPQTLDEATNIREELLEIAQKAGFDPENRKGRDLEQRIEKTLVSAFRYNVLARQRNGLYRKAKANETDIRLHNSSVLLRDKPYYALAFEIIEISEIDAEPKLSARILHELTDEDMRHYFPEFYKKQKGRERREKRRFGRWETKKGGRRRR